MICNKFQSKMGKSATEKVKKGEISKFLGGKFPPQKIHIFGLTPRKNDLQQIPEQNGEISKKIG